MRLRRLPPLSVLALALAALCVVGLVGCGSSASQETAGEALDSSSGEEPPQELAETGSADYAADATATSGEVYYATIEVADYGTIEVELLPEVAPQTVANFVRLAREGFYDGLTFHRIIDGFMIQGGDPNGDGTGGSDETVVGEFVANGIENDLSHTRGVISMARSSDPDSGSSQFFIVHEDSPFLDGQYAAFGQVVSGMDVVDAIVAAAKPVDDNGTIPPAEQPTITSITVEGPMEPRS